MVLSLDDKWVWDSWYAKDGDTWHAFFLQADKALGDPELRHWHVSYGHAISRDLVRWEQLGTCFAPTEGPAWDDYTVWTGSVTRGDDGQWHLFYTGTSHADDGKRQRLGHAVSNDLHNWERAGTGPILDIDERYEEYRKGRWHDRAFRDPWVMRDPDGDGWLMYFTARKAGVPGWLDAGAIGFATSPDLDAWTLRDPVFAGGFGELEVPQIFHREGRWYCLFCTSARFWTSAAQAIVGGAPMTGSHYLIGQTPRGPWRIAPGPMLDGADPVKRYAGRIVDTVEGMKLMGFRWFDPKTGGFVGHIDNPVDVRVEPDGRLALVEAA
ncbi:MAG: levansucrase [Pseudomonadota bacterium]